MTELTELIQKKHLPTPVTLVIDNHAAHYAHSVRYLYETTFQVLFTPAYSSELNS